MGNTHSEVVDMYSIPHRLLHDRPRVQGRAQSGRTPRLPLRQGYHHRRASTAPAPSTTPPAMRQGTRNAGLPRSGGEAVAGNGGGDSSRVYSGTEGLKRGGGTCGTGLTGRVLLQGEKVAGSVRQGQVKNKALPSVQPNIYGG